MSNRVLIIEDEPSMLRGLVDVLRLKGYVPESAVDGTNGLEMARVGNFDLILLDVMLPGISGFDLLKQLREEKNLTPVILLTAQNTEIDRVLGFELGVDDYVTKPFSVLELLGRIGAVLRRCNAEREPVPRPDLLIFGPVAVDLKRFTVKSPSGQVELPSKAFTLLKVLANRLGEAMSRDELIDAVWGADEFINHRTVNNIVLKVRQAIEPDPEDPRYLLTVHGVGYRLSQVREDDENVI